MKFVTGGGLRVDYLITHDGQVRSGLIGGNALYAAVGAALWSNEVGLWARLGENYPVAWLEQLRPFPLQTTGLIRIPGRQDHRTGGRRTFGRPVAENKGGRKPGR